MITVGLTTRHNELESFRLEAEGVCRYRGESPLAKKILLSSESVIMVLDGEMDNFLGMSSTVSIKKDI